MKVEYIVVDCWFWLIDWSYEEEETIFPFLSKSWSKQKCGTYFFYRIIIVVFKYSHFTLFLSRKHLAPFFVAGPPCCLSTCYLFKYMRKAFHTVLLVITVGNTFPLVITVENTFSLVITVRNTFPPLITVGNKFPLFITIGTRSRHL